MSKLLRYALLLAGTGIVWNCAMQLLFVWSGAQSVLANPQYQSAKFLYVFMQAEPLPRMATDASVLWKGFVVIGICIGLAFALINPYLKGSWVKRGLITGIVHWLLMTPWFEFYLPYNVMHEPLPLVLMEAALWLVVVLITNLYMSLVMNWKA